MEVGEEVVETPLLEGIVLVPANVKPEDVEKEVGIHILLENGFYTGAIPLLTPFLNQPLDVPLLQEIKNVLVNYFREEEGLYTAILIPIQEVVNGVVVLQVLKGKIGKVEFEGQKWFSPGVLQGALGIYSGDPLDETTFLNDLTWLNRNPFRKTEMIMIPSQDPGLTDLLFVTKDRFPVRGYAGIDNTGFPPTGDVRIYGGANWGNALMLGDILSYQYTASADFHMFQAHVASYTAYLSWKHLLTVFGLYGQVYPDIEDFSSEGINKQLSARYRIPILPLFGMFRSYFELGFDYLFLTSNIFFTGNPEQGDYFLNQGMTITQFLFTYDIQKNFPQSLFTFRIDMALSPWKGAFPQQTSAVYSTMRGGSHVRYAFWRIALGDTYFTEEGLTLSWLLRGQVTTGALPTAEQFALGGQDTVRGYFPQQFVADNAFCMNLEFFAPSFPVLNKGNDRLVFLTFLDYGFGQNYVTSSPEYKKQNLCGVGVGARYEIPGHLTAKFDWGFQLQKIPGDSQTGKFYFSITGSY